MLSVRKNENFVEKDQPTNKQLELFLRKMLFWNSNWKKKERRIEFDLIWFESEVLKKIECEQEWNNEKVKESNET